MYRFDPASLAILDRFDRLESLIMTNGTNAHVDQASTVLKDVSPNKESRDCLGCVQSSLINVRLEAVLLWEPVRRYIDLTSFRVVSQVPDPQLMASRDFFNEFDMTTCNALLESFWRGVHSKNPILSKDEIRRFMCYVCLNGISWDAQSCLVVRRFPGPLCPLQPS